jgi:hypothetical protein
MFKVALAAVALAAPPAMTTLPLGSVADFAGTGVICFSGRDQGSGHVVCGPSKRVGNKKTYIVAIDDRRIVVVYGGRAVFDVKEPTH